MKAFLGVPFTYECGLTAPLPLLICFLPSQNRLDLYRRLFLYASIEYIKEHVGIGGREDVPCVEIVKHDLTFVW